MACDFLDDITLPTGVTTNCAVPCVLDAILVALQTLIDQKVLMKVFEGKHRPSEVEDYEQALRDGPAEIVGIFDYCLAVREQKTQTTMGTMEIAGLLEVYLPTNVSTRMHCALQLAEMVLSIIGQESIYQSCGARPTSSKYVCEDDGIDDGIMQFSYTLVFTVPPLSGAVS